MLLGCFIQRGSSCSSVCSDPKVSRQVSVNSSLMVLGVCQLPGAGAEARPLLSGLVTSLSNIPGFCGSVSVS